MNEKEAEQLVDAYFDLLDELDEAPASGTVVLLAIVTGNLQRHPDGYGLSIRQCERFLRRLQLEKDEQGAAEIQQCLDALREHKERSDFIESWATVNAPGGEA